MTEEEFEQAEKLSMQEKEMKLIKDIHSILWDNELNNDEKIDEIKTSMCEEFAEWCLKGYETFLDWRYNKKE